MVWLHRLQGLRPASHQQGQRMALTLRLHAEQVRRLYWESSTQTAMSSAQARLPRRLAPMAILATHRALVRQLLQPARASRPHRDRSYAESQAHPPKLRLMDLSWTSSSDWRQRHLLKVAIGLRTGELSLPMIPPQPGDKSKMTSHNHQQ